MIITSSLLILISYIWNGTIFYSLISPDTDNTKLYYGLAEVSSASIWPVKHQNIVDNCECYF